MSKLQFWLLVAALAALAAVGGAWLAQRQPVQTQLAAGTWLPRPARVPEFRMRDQTGRPFGRSELQGHFNLLFFGFTNCPDVCPTTLATLAAIERRLANPSLRVLFISVDPERDTPEQIAAYLRAFSRGFVGLRGDTAELNGLMRGLGMAYDRRLLADGSYSVNHSSTLTLTDQRGNALAVFTAPLDREALMADLRTICGR
jgi:protein SCO1/2